MSTFLRLSSWLTLAYVLSLGLTGWYAEATASFDHNIDDSIYILSFSSKLQGLFQVPGYLGSLLQNTAANRIELHLFVDTHNYFLLKPCQEGMMSVFRDVTIRSMHELSSSFIGSNLTSTLSATNEDISQYYHRYHSGLYKLDFLNLMPKSISRALVLDIDVLVFDDISYLWSEADRVPGKFLYMAEDGYSEDSYYGSYSYGNKKEHYFHPYGVNAGVILADLDAIRYENITAHSLLRDNDEEIRIPDQDIINTWAHYNPKSIGVLSCKWNTRPHSPCYNRDIMTDPTRIDRGIFHGTTKLYKPIFVETVDPQFEFEQRMHRNYTQYFYDFCNITNSALEYVWNRARKQPSMRLADMRRKL